MKVSALTPEQARHIGQQVVDMLGLKAKDCKYETSWGNKTLEGLGRCIDRIVQESIPEVA